MHFAITNRNGDTVAEADADAADAKTNIKMENAHLWHGTEDPYLYTLTVTLLQNGKAVDEIATRFGCRSFAIDPQTRIGRESATPSPPRSTQRIWI